MERLLLVGFVAVGCGPAPPAAPPAPRPEPQPAPIVSPSPSAQLAPSSADSAAPSPPPLTAEQKRARAVELLTGGQAALDLPVDAGWWGAGISNRFRVTGGARVVKGQLQNYGRLDRALRLFAEQCLRTTFATSTGPRSGLLVLHVRFDEDGALAEARVDGDTTPPLSACLRERLQGTRLRLEPDSDAVEFVARLQYASE